MSQYSREQYERERRSIHRTYANGNHSYPEWVWMKRWEAGEVGNPPAPNKLSDCLDFLRREYPLTYETFVGRDDNAERDKLLDCIHESKIFLAKGKISAARAFDMIERQAVRVRT